MVVLRIWKLIFETILFMILPTEKVWSLTLHKHIREVPKLKTYTLTCWLQTKADNI